MDVSRATSINGMLLTMVTWYSAKLVSNNSGKPDSKVVIKVPRLNVSIQLREPHDQLQNACLVLMFQILIVNSCCLDFKKGGHKSVRHQT